MIDFQMMVITEKLQFVDCDNLKVLQQLWMDKLGSGFTEWCDVPLEIK